MSRIIKFKPKPRNFRDRLEFWIIWSDGRWFRYNLAFLLPLLGSAIGSGIGYVVSMSRNPDPWLSYLNPERYLPIVWGLACGAVAGCIIRNIIVGKYYLDEAPARDGEQYNRLLEKLRSGKRSAKKKRPRPLDDE